MLGVANEDFTDEDKTIKQMKDRLLPARTVHDRTSCGGNTIEGYTGCSKSLGHILTLNVSKTIKEITMCLIYSESLQSQVFYRMFKDVQCEHR